MAAGLAEHFAARLDGQLASLRALVEGCDDERLTCRVQADKWSAAENLAHLGRYHEAFLERLAAILAEASPELRRYRAEDDPGFAEWTGRSPSRLLEDLTARRRDLRQRLLELDAAGWQRTGRHPAFGAMTVMEWVDFFLVHEAHHLYVIRLRLAGV